MFQKIFVDPVDYNINIFKQSDTLIIQFDMLTVCNLNCYYCCVKNRNNYKAHVMNTDNLYQICYYLKQINYNNIILFFAGGEPTLYPNFKDILWKVQDIFKSKNLLLAFATNFTKNIEWFKSGFPNILAYITYNYYNRKNINDFIYRLKLIDKNIKIKINFMLDPYFDINILIEHFNILKENMFEIRPFFISNDSDSYLKEYNNFTNFKFLENMNKHLKYDDIFINEYLKVIDDKYEKLQGYYCLNNFLTINSYGNIFRYCGGENYMSALDPLVIDMLNNLNLLEYKCPRPYCRMYGGPVYKQKEPFNV